MLALYQGEPAFADKAANLATVERISRAARLAGARLVVFPELFLTGYNIVTQAHNLAEPVDGPMIERVRAIAREEGIAIAAGYPERDGETLYNSAALIDETGEIAAHYRKIHLFGDREPQAFAVGRGVPVVELGPWKVGLVICYDIELPETARALARAVANVIVVPTANMMPYTEVPTTLVRARALENGVCVGYANLSGAEGDLTYTGGSVIVGPDGLDLARAGFKHEALLVADVSAALADPDTLPFRSTQEDDLLEDRLKG